MSNVESVQRLYEAFGRGDIPAVLEALSEDVEWEPWEANTAQRAGVPWLQPRRGRDGVAQFFAIVGTFEIREFTVRSLLDGGDRVAAEILIDGVAPTGEEIRDEELHVWYFDGDSRVKAMRHWVDTAKHMRAARVEAPVG